MFEKNVGTTDRVIRFVIGVALLVSGLFLINAGTTTLGYFLAGFSVIPFGTSLLSTCPIYSILGISTNSSKA